MMLKLIVHKHNEYPTDSSAFGEQVFRERGSGLNSYVLLYFDMANEKLPYSYQTNCKNHDKTYCTRKCINEKTIDEFNKLPFSFPIHEVAHLRYKLMWSVHLNDPVKAEIFYNLTRKCNNICSAADCYSSAVITRLYEELTDENLLRFRVNIPKEPSTNITYIAELHLTEVIVYLLSCFGTWFGVSVLGLKTIFHNIFEKYRNRNTTNKRKLIKLNAEIELVKLKRVTNEIWRTYRSVTLANSREREMSMANENKLSVRINSLKQEIKNLFECKVIYYKL